jgi:hypothetical protein
VPRAAAWAVEEEARMILSKPVAAALAPRFARVAMSAAAVTALLAAAPAAAAAQEPAAAPGVAQPVAPEVVRYGVGVRMPRLVTVPGWFLDLFTKQNVPLATFGAFGFEFLRRKGDFDIVFGIGYQNMSPGDGNWLGKGKDASVDTDFVQFRDLAMIGVDVAFVQRRMFTRYIGMHYGAGLGLALVRGELLRISNAGCNESNAGDESVCRPQPCPPSGCNEAMLKATEGGVDGGPTMPSRFRDNNVPGAIPILNMTLGVDLVLPELQGFEARLEGGFYNAFFVGLAFGYVF